MGTIYGLSNNDLMKKDDIIMMSYNEIRLKLYYDHEMSEYQDRYRALLKKQGLS